MNIYRLIKILTGDGMNCLKLINHLHNNKRIHFHCNVIVKYYAGAIRKILLPVESKCEFNTCLGSICSKFLNLFYDIINNCQWKKKELIS